jgi:hypothetical protein
LALFFKLTHRHRGAIHAIGKAQRHKASALKCQISKIKQKNHISKLKNGVPAFS